VEDHLCVPNLLQVIPGAVRGKIVDQNDLLIDRDLLDGGKDPIDVIALVVDRDDDRELDDPLPLI
jgi:hypothetical protein